MKQMKFMLILAVLMSGVLVANAQKEGEKTVVFSANLHCASCKTKIEKNIPFEKGIKGLEVNMEENTIKVTFQEEKNTVGGVQKAIEKLGIEVKGIANCPYSGNKKCDKANCDKPCGQVKEKCDKRAGCCGQNKK